MPEFLSYLLSFIYVGIYWSNHHHVFQVVRRVSGFTLWANLHLLFWLSLIPFTTAWMGESHLSTWPVVVYGGVLFMAAIAWEIERHALLRHHEDDSALARALGGRLTLKEGASLTLYALAIALAFVSAWIACALYAVVAAIWLSPDRRVERELATNDHEHEH